MFPIPAAGQVAQQQPQELGIPANPQDQLVNDASQGVFGRAQEFAGRAWGFVTIGFNAAFDKVTFLFFRVFNFIFPSLGPTVENAFLRVCNIWQSIKDAWHQEEIRKEMDQLRIQNHEMQVKTRDYDYLVEKNGQLTEERNRLEMNHRELVHAKDLAEKLIRIAVEQEANLVGREQHADRYRNIVVLKNQELEQTVVRIKQERDLAQRNYSQTLRNNQDLQLKLAQAQQAVHDLQVQMPNHQALLNRLDQLAKSAQSIPQTGRRTELDDGLANLLPLLLEQIDEAQNHLDQAKDALPQGSNAAKVALQSFERILGEIKDYLERIPQTLKLHANWNQSVHNLMFLTQQAQEV